MKSQLHSSKMERFEIQEVEQIEADEIVRIKNIHFHNSDPVEIAHRSNEHRTANADSIIFAIKNGFVLKAVETATSTIVGFIIARPVDAKIFDELEQSVAAETDQNSIDILKFLVYLFGKAIILGQLNIKQTMHLRSLCVLHNKDRRKVGNGKNLKCDLRRIQQSSR